MCRKVIGVIGVEGRDGEGVHDIMGRPRASNDLNALLYVFTLGRPQ